MSAHGRLIINVDGMIRWIGADAKKLQSTFEDIAESIKTEGIKIMREEVPHGATNKLADSIKGEVISRKNGGTIRVYADTPYAKLIDGDGRTDAHDISPKGKKVLKFAGSSPRQQIFREALKHPYVKVGPVMALKIRPSEARRAAMETPIKEGRLRGGHLGEFRPKSEGRGNIVIKKGLGMKSYREQTIRHELWHAVEHAAGIPYRGMRSESYTGIRTLASGLDTTVFSHKVHHPGSKQTPFTRRTLEKLREVAMKKVQEAIRSV